MARLFPPECFGMVESGVYRSAFPSEVNFSFLQTLNLKTMVLLDAARGSPSATSKTSVDLSTQLTEGNNTTDEDFSDALRQQQQQQQHQQQQFNSGASAVLPSFLEDLAIRVIYVDNPGHTSAVSEELVVTSLHTLINPDNHPLLLACVSGRFLTGAVVGCLRKMQHWSLASVFEEYRRFAGQRLHQQHEQFVELFDTDLVVLNSFSADFVVRK